MADHGSAPLAPLETRMNIRQAIAAIITAYSSCTAFAGLYPTYPLGVVPGTWQQDRYPPAVFANGGAINGRANVLDLGIANADSLLNRPIGFSTTFYNTQGRGFTIDLPAYSV